MGIMAAGMHKTFMSGSKWKSCLFFDRKSIHICAQADGLSRLSAFNSSNNPAVLFRAYIRDTYLIQLCCYIGSCFRQMQAKLRDLMQISSQSYDIFL